MFGENKIIKKECCGCRACEEICCSSAISLVKDEYGFYYPVIDKDKCVLCGKCEKVCPYNTEEELFKSPIETYAAINLDSVDVYNSSSGGIFIAFARQIIQEGGIVYGCMMDDKNIVKHVRVDKISELLKLQKSKYVQSNLEGIYSQIKKDINEKRRVLFVGTPCQVAGLYSFLRSNKNEHLLTIDIVCHGVPSQEFFDDYLSVLNKKYNNSVTKYMFRAKKKAENGMNWYFSYEHNAKKVFRNWPEDSFNYLYMQSLCYRESCYECKFAKKERMADITLCDYWGWDNYHKQDFKMGSTVSGIVVNSDLGKFMLNKVSRKLKLVPTKYEDLSRHNSCLVTGKEKNELRDIVLKNWKLYGYEFIDKHFQKQMKFVILKYKIMRFVPEKIKYVLWRIKNGY